MIYQIINFLKITNLLFPVKFTQVMVIWWQIFHRKKEYLFHLIQFQKNVINAFLSAEDKNFFKHPGVDAKGVIRGCNK